MEIPLIKEILIIFGLSIAVLLVCHRLRVPIIVGFLLTGVLCGPHDLALIEKTENVQILAEIGIVLLLFTLGMEFSIRRILEFKRFFFLGGFLQVGLTTLGGFLSALLLGRPMREAIFLGFLLALSSTTIVMRILEQRREVASPHGRLILGTLIFQDVAVVLMMLLVPLLAGNVIDQSFLFLIGKGILLLVFVFFSAERLVPILLFQVAKTQSRELFLLTVLLICFSVAWIASSFGLSLSIGAFLAGLIIAESEYSHKAIGDVLPFKDIFTSFFFVSIGMLLNIQFVIAQPFLILLITLGVFLLKALVMVLTAIILGMPLRIVVLSALALAQVGEFSFVLAKAGIAQGIGEDYYYQLFLSVSILTMAATPLLIKFSPKIAKYVLRWPLPSKLKSGVVELVTREKRKDENHVIIVGLGFTGKNLVRSSKEAHIPYVILEMDPVIVRTEKKMGEPIYFGDATHESVLEHANITKARAIAVLINDPIAALRVVEIAKRLNPSVYLIARARYAEEMKPMFQLGADDVIVDEFGSSVEIFTRVLRKYDIPHDRIEGLVNDLRTEGYEMLRLVYQDPMVFSDLTLQEAGFDIEKFLLTESSPLAGKTIAESELRKTYGVTIILVRRQNETLSRVDGETKLYPNDVLVVIGNKEQLERIRSIF